MVELSDISGGIFFFILICLVLSLTYLYKNICCRSNNQKNDIEDLTNGRVNSANPKYNHNCKVLNQFNSNHNSIEFIEQDDTHFNYICYYSCSGRLAIYDLSTDSLIAQGMGLLHS